MTPDLSWKLLLDGCHQEEGDGEVQGTDWQRCRSLSVSRTISTLRVYSTRQEELLASYSKQ